jgi:hypothetical protein
VALALGLAFGLGGRDTAAIIVRNWYEKSREQAARASGALDTAPVSASASAADRATTETVENDPASWPTGGYPGPGMGPTPANKRHDAEGG